MNYRYGNGKTGSGQNFSPTNFLFSAPLLTAMKQFVLFSFLSISILFAANCRNEGKAAGNNSVSDSLNKALLLSKAKQASTFCEKEKMNQGFCILANMSIHSGMTRVYVWDFKQNKAIDSGLTSHGCGNNPWSGTSSKEKPTFSNVDGSHCSSLGKYRIGKRGYSNWGINVNYLLHGLEHTNNNALARQVVLHSWEVVSETPVYPEGTPEGWGCPAISNGLMTRLDNRLKNAERPVLLWMFYE